MSDAGTVGDNGHRPVGAYHLRDGAGDGHQHARRDLYGGHVRRLDRRDPDLYPRNAGGRGDDDGRLSDGQERRGGACARNLAYGLICRRHDQLHHSSYHRAAAGQYRGDVRPR